MYVLLCKTGMYVRQCPLDIQGGGGGACIEVRAQFLFFEIQSSIIFFSSFWGTIIFLSQILRAQLFFITVGKCTKGQEIALP